MQWREGGREGERERSSKRETRAERERERERETRDESRMRESWGWGGVLNAISVYYSGTSDKGPSEKGTTSLQRTLLQVPLP